MPNSFNTKLSYVQELFTSRETDNISIPGIVTDDEIEHFRSYGIEVERELFGYLRFKQIPA